ncbi:MAG: lipopolysaccharide transport system permease protein [Saprospiraceae bacterium]|jgi:lipopolysaccharide transport system permease protein
MQTNKYRSSFRDIFLPLFEHTHLIKQLTKRGILGRYRGSVLGLAWSLLTPLLMLMVYTIVFSVVFQARWDHPDAQNANFGVILFSGMIIHALFCEPMVTSAQSIIQNSQYVKKVVFPLPVLAWITLFVALFQSLLSLIVLLLFMLITGMTVHLTLLWLPVVVLPLMMLALGVSWLLSSTTVYLRDVGQIVGIISTVFLFISPVFYPVDRLPGLWQKLIYLNPISFIVDQVRQVLIYGNQPDWVGLCIYSLVALGVAWLGLVWFQKLRPGFADVL